MHTKTVTCETSVLVSMMKRITLMKPKAALTISLVRDANSRQTLCSSCSMVLTSIESGNTKIADWIQTTKQSIQNIRTASSHTVNRLVYWSLWEMHPLHLTQADTGRTATQNSFRGVRLLSLNKQYWQHGERSVWLSPCCLLSAIPTPWSVHGTECWCRNMCHPEVPG